MSKACLQPSAIWDMLEVPHVQALERNAEFNQMSKNPCEGLFQIIEVACFIGHPHMRPIWASTDVLSLSEAMCERCGQAVVHLTS